MTLSQMVRQLRYAKGWGPDDLASRANISRTALYQIESGKTSLPRAATLRRIARALGVGPEQLLARSDDLGERSSGDEIEVHLDSEMVGGRSVVELADSDALSSIPALRELDLERKFKLLLASPLRDSIARIVDETYRMVVQDQRHEAV